MVLRAALFAFIDQAILSALNMLVGVLFVYRGTTGEYAIYTAFLSAFYLMGTVQNAVTNTPMMVMAPRLPDEDRAIFNRGMLGLLLLAVAPACLLVALACSAFAVRASITWASTLAFGAAFIPLVLRDHFRAQEYSLLHPSVALRRDALYVVAAIIGIVALCQPELKALPVFLVLSAAACLPVLPAAFEGLSRGLRWLEVRSAATSSWSLAKWSLVGAGSAWVQSYSYVFVPFVLLGAREVAYLAAARLIVSPVTLLGQGWGNYFRPRASHYLSSGDWAAARRLFVSSTIHLLTMVALYVLVVDVALNVLPRSLLPHAYQGVQSYVLAWGAVVVLQLLRGNTSTLLQAALSFRRLAVCGLVSAAVTVIATAAFVLTWGGIGALLGLFLGEIVLTTSLLIALRRDVFLTASAKAVVG